MDAKLRQELQRVLSAVDDRTHGPRLLDDALRLWQRMQHLLALNLIPAPANLAALELASYALQLPLRQGKNLHSSKTGRTNLKERAEQASEMLVSLFGESADETLIERTTELLRDIPQRTPRHDEGKLLADAVNLEDFGVIGLFAQTVTLARQGGGVLQVNEGCQKRDLYGYWDARMKEGFHFEPVRQIARQRLEKARLVCRLLEQELDQDRGGHE